MNFDIYLGLEIEASYNADLLRINRGDYKNGNINNYYSKYFVAERDSSLDARKLGWSTVELKSIPLRDRDVIPALVSLKKRMISQATRRNPYLFPNNVVDGKKPELRDLLDFNSSTGAHIHISARKKLKGRTIGQDLNYCGKHVRLNGCDANIKKFVPYQFFARVRRDVDKQIELRLPEIYPKYKRHYNRSYAKCINKYNSGDRYTEFNINTDSGVTIEWRSFNLCGVETWSDFFTMYDIVADAIRRNWQIELRKYRPFEQKHEISIAESKNIKQRVGHVIIAPVHAERQRKQITIRI